MGPEAREVIPHQASYIVEPLTEAETNTDHREQAGLRDLGPSLTVDSSSAHSLVVRAGSNLPAGTEGPPEL